MWVIRNQCSSKKIFLPHNAISILVKLTNFKKLRSYHFSGPHLVYEAINMQIEHLSKSYLFIHLFWIEPLSAFYCWLCSCLGDSPSFFLVTIITFVGNYTFLSCYNKRDKGENFQWLHLWQLSKKGISSLWSNFLLLPVVSTCGEVWGCQELDAGG